MRATSASVTTMATGMSATATDHGFFANEVSTTPIASEKALQRKRRVRKNYLASRGKHSMFQWLVFLVAFSVISCLSNILLLHRHYDTLSSLSSQPTPLSINVDRNISSDLLQGSTRHSLRSFGMEVKVVTPISNHSNGTHNRTGIERLKDIANGHKMDFGGHGRTEFAYRLGDVFDLWYLHQYKMTFNQLVTLYETLFPNTLAHEYLVQVASPTYAHRNLTALLRVIAKQESSMQEASKSSISWMNTPSSDDLVVHLRLGDVLTSSCCTNLNQSIQSLWYAPKGFVNRDCLIKHNYNFVEFQSLVQRLPAQHNIRRCVLVGASNFVINTAYANRNQEYKDLVVDFLQQSVDCQVVEYENPHPDQTLVYLASAQRLIVAMGGYAQIAAACAQARGGFVLHDKFNGHIAGWNSPWFDARQKQIFAASYIDWNALNSTALEMIWKAETDKYEE